MDNLDNLRKEIDHIDKELIKLFEKRIENVLRIGEYMGVHLPYLINSLC